MAIDWNFWRLVLVIDGFDYVLLFNVVIHYHLQKKSPRSSSE